MSAPVAELVHVWNHCHACGAAPITGLRFECQVCPVGPDNDLCEACYRLLEQGRVAHPSPQSRATPAAGRHALRAVEGPSREQVLPWLAVPWPAALAPPVPDRCVVRPEFRSGRESFFGSYGFVVEAEDGGAPLLLTALHVMDELSKLKGIDCSEDNAAYTGRELPPQVTKVQLYDVFAANWMLAELGIAGDMLSLPDARNCAEEPYSHRDIAAFRVAPSALVNPVRLASAPPVVGEPIWLAISRAPQALERTSQAVVVEMTDRSMVFRFAPGASLPPYASGAPVLDRMGDVVGINVGTGMLDGHRLGHANPVTSVRRHLGWS